MAELEIRNLHVNAGDKQILKGVDLKVASGEIHALMGPNGSGKSTLANAVMGHPGLEVTEGQIIFDGEDITEAEPDERARAGLFMAFQYPVAVPGVTVAKYLRTVINAHREGRGEQTHLPQGLPQDGRGRDAADRGAEGVLEPLPQRRLLRRREEAHGDPPARAPAAQARRHGRDGLRPRRRRAQGRLRRRQRRARDVADGHPHHHALPADPAPDQADGRPRHVRGPDRQAGRAGARHADRGDGYAAIRAEVEAAA